MAKDFDVITGAGVVTVPISTTGSATGEIVSGKKSIFGTDLDELQRGDWVINLVTSERRKVKAVHSATHIELFKAFGNAKASAVLVIVKKADSAAVYMNLTAVGDILVDGETVLDGTSVDFGYSNDSGSPTKFIKPRFVNPQTGSCRFNVEYFSNNFAD